MTKLLSLLAALLIIAFFSPVVYAQYSPQSVQCVNGFGP